MNWMKEVRSALRSTSSTIIERELCSYNVVHVVRGSSIIRRSTLLYQINVICVETSIPELGVDFDIFI